MSVRVVEQAVEGVNSGEIAVRRESEYVMVKWFCGAAQRFNVDDLRVAIANVDAVKKYVAWLRITDSYKSTFVACVKDGNLYADEFPAELDSESAQCVPWADLKKALKKAMEE